MLSNPRHVFRSQAKICGTHPPGNCIDQSGGVLAQDILCDHSTDFQGLLNVKTVVGGDYTD